MFGLPNHIETLVSEIFFGSLSLLATHLLYNPRSPLSYEVHPVLSAPTSRQVCEGSRWELSALKKCDSLAGDNADCYHVQTTHEFSLSTAAVALDHPTEHIHPKPIICRRKRWGISVMS